MTEERYTPRQLQIIRGEIPDKEIITAEYTRILKWAAECGDNDVIEIIQPFRDERKKRAARNQYAHVTKYVARHYDRIQVLFPSEHRDTLKKIASENGVSLSRFCVMAICEKAGLPIPDEKE